MLKVQTFMKKKQMWLISTLEKKIKQKKETLYNKIRTQVINLRAEHAILCATGDHADLKRLARL